MKAKVWVWERTMSEKTKAHAETVMEDVKEEKKKVSESKSENVGEKDEVAEAAKIVVKDERSGVAYIFSSFNNTIVHITDLAGNTISRVSGGMVTKHSRLKANPTTAMFVAKRAAERARDVGITSLYIRTRASTGSPGMGPGSHAAVKTLAKEGFKIISIVETTRVPRGGPKKKGGKRGRRV